MKYLLACICLAATIATAGETPLVKRPTGRKVASTNAPECKYVESPWGTPCRVTCEMHYYPMFFSDSRVVEFKMMTNDNDDPVSSSFDFTDQNGVLVTPNSPDALKWVEWWSRSPGEEYKTVPLRGCYCNDYEGVVYICQDGVLVEIKGLSALEEEDDE
jgi:hypothetical protein